MGFLTDLLFSLDISKAPRASKAVPFHEMILRHRIEYEKKQAAHRKQRLARGLSERAGSAPPAPRILIHALPLPDLDLTIQPTEPLREDHAAAAKVIRNRYGLDVSHTLSTIQAAKDARDRHVLAGLPIGASRVGGLPDLPPGQDWPQINGKKIPFVAQLNLAQFPAAHRLLPPDGHLLFFVLVSNEEGFWPAPARVLFHRGPADSLTRSAFPAADEIHPDWRNERVYEIFAATANPPGRPAHKRSRKTGDTLGHLFGEFDFDQTPGDVADERFEDGDDWTTLLALDSEGSMQWSDAGDLYFVARRSAIACQDFSNVLAEVCSN